MSEEQKQYGKRQPFGVQISPVLEELEAALWELEFYSGEKPCYTINGFRACAKIFMSTMMDKMFDMQDYDNLDMEERKKMAVKCGKDIRKLIKSYTGIDMHKVYSEK